jgi:hypothetical protein
MAPRLKTSAATDAACPPQHLRRREAQRSASLTGPGVERPRRPQVEQAHARRSEERVARLQVEVQQAPAMQVPGDIDELGEGRQPVREAVRAEGLGERQAVDPARREARHPPAQRRGVHTVHHAGELEQPGVPQLAEGARLPRQLVRCGAPGRRELHHTGRPREAVLRHDGDVGCVRRGDPDQTVPASEQQRGLDAVDARIVRHAGRAVQRRRSAGTERPTLGFLQGNSGKMKFP